MTIQKRHQKRKAVFRAWLDGRRYPVEPTYPTYGEY